MGIKKRHHYLPRVYLAGFSNPEDGKIWTYKKLIPNTPWSTHVDNVAFVKKLYHLEDTKDDINTVEDFFGNNVEDPAAIPLQKLRNKQFPQAEDRKHLSLFFAFLIITMTNH